MKQLKLYELGDNLSYIESKYFETDKDTCPYPDIKAIQANEHRKPQAGEWYLSGAIPEAYRAPNDLSTVYHIARIIKIEMVTTYNIIKG